MRGRELGLPLIERPCYFPRVNLCRSHTRLSLPSRSGVGGACRNRGFTLTELMVVIVLISVLAALAYPSLRKRIEEAHGREGVGQMRAIAGAQERFRSEHMMYLDVSPNNTLYPNPSPNTTRYHFRQPAHADYARWEVLAPEIKVPTPYSFLSRAGLAGATLPTNPMGLAWPTTLPGGPWYYVYGVGDIDGDGVQQKMLVSSFEPQVVLTGAGE